MFKSSSGILSGKQNQISIWLHTQQASKGDGRRQSSKVDENNGGQSLGVQGICEVALVVLVASLYVSNHPAEWPTGA